MEYLIKSSLVIILFWLFYKIFLEKETFFQANRLFFISAIILALGLPLWQIPIYKTIVIETSNQALVNSSSDIIMTDIWNFKQIFKLLYFLGILFFTIKYIISLIGLVLFIKKSPIETVNNIKIIYTRKNLSPFSFFNYIILPKEGLTKQEYQTIIEHEKLHIEQAHSIDLILLNLIQILQWINPFIWFFGRSLRQNLEFIADDLSKDRIISEKSYQYLLLKTATKNTAFGLHTNFNYSFIKKRIIMMQQKKSNRQNLLKYLLILPILGLFMMSFNTKEVINYKIKNQENKILTRRGKGNSVVVISKKTTDKELKSYQEKFEKIGIVFKYSGVKRNEKNEITSIKLYLKDNKENQERSLSIANNVKPINKIVLGIFDGKLFISENDDSELVFEIRDGSAKKEFNPPLYILNGKIIDKKTLNALESGKIKNIIIIKGEKAIEKYGKKGANGVIEMYTKTNENNTQGNKSTGYVRYKGKQYFYSIKNKKVTFYNKFGEQIRDEKLIQKLKEKL